jgi:hypothetical protein
LGRHLRRLSIEPSHSLIELATIRRCSTIAGFHRVGRRRGAGVRGGPVAGTGAQYLRGRR